MNTSFDVITHDLDHILDMLEEEMAIMAGSSLLITGGAGFLGYYLVQSMLHWNTRVGQEKAVRVTVYDNYIRGMPRWLRDLSGDPNLKPVRHDITHHLPKDMEGFDYIIHGASIASPTYYRKYPIETMDANVGGLRQLLDHCLERQRRGAPVKGVLFYSTSEIYGDPSPENIPTPETYRGNVSCTGPRACYDESKRFGETLCVNFAKAHGLPVTIARPFNNYGPGLKITDKRVLPDFARDVLAGRDITMRSNGSPTRTFCYTADAIAGYYKILIRGVPGEAYNIGVDTPEISMAELAEMVVRQSRELFGYHGRIVHQPSTEPDYLVDNPNRRCPVIDKARKELGYTPSIGLEEGLRRTLIWYRDNQEAEEA
jgi:UDP-glucuronate decarboxylase